MNKEQTNLQFAIAIIALLTPLRSRSLVHFDSLSGCGDA